MKVQFGYHILARGAYYHEVPVDFRVGACRLVQSIHCIGAKSAQKVDRGNLQHTLHFTVVKKHPDVEAAMMHALQHATALQDQRGNLHCVSEDVSKTITLESAVIESIESLVRGPLTHDRYTIVGGHITQNTK